MRNQAIHEAMRQHVEFAFFKQLLTAKGLVATSTAITITLRAELMEIAIFNGWRSPSNS